MQRQLINRGKEAVYVQDHAQLKQLYAETHNGDYQLSVADIFLQLFYYACQHNRKNTISIKKISYFKPTKQCNPS